jgi:hypothetical protein
VSQRKRNRVEEISGCAKTVGGGRRLRNLGLERKWLWTEMTAAAYNLVRLSNLPRYRPEAEEEWPEWTTTMVDGTLTEVIGSRNHPTPSPKSRRVVSPGGVRSYFNPLLALC